MDISLKVGDGRFNYRVCAMMIEGGRILAMRDKDTTHYYLPGGRVGLGEIAEEAVVREVEEELGVRPEIVRPLWLNQAFYNEEDGSGRVHELCLYFLMDVSKTDLPSRGDRFVLTEGEKVHTFEWMEFDRLEREYFYPLFLKTEIFHLPETFTLHTEVQ